MNDEPTTRDVGSLYALPKNLVLAASAGTGKTYALVGVIVHLLVRGPDGEEPLDPARIVATTFSRKAAAEIRERATTELERLAAAPDSSTYAPGLREALARRGSDALVAARARKALARIGHARFGTLHSFATGIVRAYALELGLGPGFELASESEARVRIEDAIARAIEERFEREPQPVRALVDAAGGVDRLVAQLRRILGQLEEDGRPARELTPPTHDAATIEALLRSLVEHAEALTSHPRFEVVARGVVSAWREGNETGLEEAVAALCAVPATGKKSPELESFALFRKELAGTTNEEKGRRLVRAFRARGEFLPAAMLVRDLLAASEATILESGRGKATLGFGEILRAARELLRDRPDVADDVATGIDALLVDEFQDTSRVQRDLVQLLWAKTGSRIAGAVPPLASVRPRGLLVVGDRKQSIYGFRGADVSVFAEIAVGLAGEPARRALGIPPGMTWEPAEPSADFCALRHNRRSVPEILGFANAFSARRFRPGDPPPELFEIEYVPSTEDLLVPPERVAEPTDGAAKTTWLRVAPKGNASTRLEEGLVIAERVRRIVESGLPLVGRERRRPEHRDIAVLATTNGMLDAVAFALAQAEIPYVVAGKGFFRTREVRDLAAMLRLVLDPSDRIAPIEILRGPWASVHDLTLLGLSREGEGLVPMASWHDPPRPDLVRDEDRPRLLRVREVVGSLARCAGRLGPGSVLREAALGLQLPTVLGLLPRGEQRVANVDKLLAIADRHADTRAFLSWLDDATEQELAESEAATFSDDENAVRLLTIHASKGLDFPIVFLPEIGAGLPPAEKGAVRVALGTGADPNVLVVRLAGEGGVVLEPPSFEGVHERARRRDRAERQRLAYVAVTRAADAMFLVGGRAKDGPVDAGATTLGAVLEIAQDPALAARAGLAVEDVGVPTPSPRPPALAQARPAVEAEEAPRPVVAWKRLPIAPTALADFDYCARRFELVHVLGLPEHVARPSRTSEVSPPRPGAREEGVLDARTQGTLAHAVLERVPVEAFGTDDPDLASRALEAVGIPAAHPQHAAIVGRVVRFLGSAYAKNIVAEGATLAREVGFVLSIDDREGRAVVLRGSMDLVVTWPDGSVDVVDYKSARGKGNAALYSFQLGVYALAARAEHPNAPRLRAGLVFLGGSAAEPAWRPLGDEREVKAQLAALGDRLVTARWQETFPRVELASCEAITCGFIGRCHADAPRQ